MTIKMLCIRQILRDVRQLPAERQTGVLEIFRAAVGVARRDDFPGPGEGVRLYRAKVDPAQRAQTRHRVVEALKRGEPVHVICRRERVSRSWVYKVKASTARP
jgi:hypothetical protein